MRKFLLALFDVTRILLAIAAGYYTLQQANDLSNPSQASGQYVDPSYASGRYVVSIAGLVIGSSVCVLLIWSFWWRPKSSKRGGQ